MILLSNGRLVSDDRLLSSASTVVIPFQVWVEQLFDTAIDDFVCDFVSHFDRLLNSFQSCCELGQFRSLQFLTSEERFPNNVAQLRFAFFVELS